MSLAHATPLSSLGRNPGAAAVHVLASALYAAVAWLALLAWAAIAGAPGAVLAVVAISPFVVSGVIVILLVGWLAWRACRWLWLNRATLRLRRYTSA